MQHVLEIEEFYYKQQNFNVMARAKKTDQEKQEFIDLHFNEYKAVLGWNFDVNEWEKLDLEKQYRRVYDWLRRQENKEKEEVKKAEEKLTEKLNTWYDCLMEIDSYSLVEILKLKDNINRYIDSSIRRKKNKEIAEKEKELAEFDQETKRQLQGLEEQRQEEKEAKQAQLKRLKDKLNELQG